MQRYRHPLKPALEHRFDVFRMRYDHFFKVVSLLVTHDSRKNAVRYAVFQLNCKRDFRQGMRLYLAAVFFLRYRNNHFGVGIFDDYDMIMVLVLVAVYCRKTCGKSRTVCNHR